MSGLLRAGWLALVAILIALPGKGLAQGEAEKKTPPSDSEKAEARAILRDLMELSDSLKKEKSKDSGPPKEKAARKELTDAEVLEKAARPARKVEKVDFEPSKIDAMLDEAYTKAKVVPAKITGDEEFIRRVTLDVTGLLPSPGQVITFRKSTDKGKRAALIESLLASPDYARNWARYFRDVVQFHATAQNPGLVRYPSLEDWLADQFAKNRPWDEIASEMITATGSTAQNGATVLTAAHEGQAVEMAGEVSRVFLGVQIQCAQCHDHPTDPWKREQFHEFAAFFGGIQTRNMPKADDGPRIEVIDRKGPFGYKMPDLKDPTKQIPVAPKFFLADEKSKLPGNLSVAQRRMLAASYVTGQDNPWFAKAFVNRAWYALMGDGFFNPVDDIGPTRTAHESEILDALADSFQKSGYDIRSLFRTILNTKAYQREFRSVNTAAGKTPFAANCPSRLRADQLMDALAQALKIDFEPIIPQGKKGEAKAAQKEANQQVKQVAKAKMPLAPGGRLRGPRALFNQTFGVDPSMPNEDVLGTIPQALFLMNSPVINRAISGPQSIVTEIMASSPNERVALEALYLRVLARSPSYSEVQSCGKYIMGVGNRREAFEDILWALVNSTEFLSRK